MNENDQINTEGQMNTDEKLLRDGLAELVRTKPDLGPIDLDDVVARRDGRSGRTPVTRWLAVAAAIVLVAGLGLGLWFGVGNRLDPQVVTAQPSTPGATATPADPAARLVGTTWLLSEINGHEALPNARAQVPSLRLTDADQVAAHDTCNQIGGSYRLDGERLTFDDLVTTLIGCRERADVAKQHGAYLQALDDVTRFTLQGSALTLFNADGRSILVFRAAADPSPTPVSTVQIRVRNESSVDFEKVVVGFPTGRVNYGSLAAGGLSDYRRAGEAYQYAYIKVTVAGRDLILQPRDYVGETPLSPGRYTYVLTAGKGSLDLRLETDQ